MGMFVDACRKRFKTQADWYAKKGFAVGSSAPAPQPTTAGGSSSAPTVHAAPAAQAAASPSTALPTSVQNSIQAFVAAKNSVSTDSRLDEPSLWRKNYIQLHQCYVLVLYC